MHSEGQEGLACSSQWDSKESDTTELLNNNNNMHDCESVNNMHDCESVLKRVTREEREEC